MIRTIIRGSIAALLVLSVTAVICTTVYGEPFANVPAFVTIASCWYLVAVAVGDQIIKNWRSKRAAQQLGWNTFLSNLFENIAWVLLTYATGDPVYLASRVLGLFFDQIVFWQMLVSSSKAAVMGTNQVLLRYASIPFILSIFALVGVPFVFPEIRSDVGIKLINATTVVFWSWTAVGWALQLHKNWKVGPITGRDFSLWIPVLIEIYLISAIANEFFSGTNRFVPYLCMSIGLTINTLLTIQTLYYWRRWHELQTGASSAAGAIKP